MCPPSLRSLTLLLHTIQLASRISSCSARNATSSGCGASGARTTWTQTLGRSKRKPKLRSTTSSRRPPALRPKAPSLRLPSSAARTSRSPPTRPCAPLTPAPTTRQETSASSSSRHGQRRLYEPDLHTPTSRQAYSHLPTRSGLPLGFRFGSAHPIIGRGFFIALVHTHPHPDVQSPLDSHEPLPGFSHSKRASPHRPADRVRGSHFVSFIIL